MILNDRKEFKIRVRILKEKISSDWNHSCIARDQGWIDSVSSENRLELFNIKVNKRHYLTNMPKHVSAWRRANFSEFPVISKCQDDIKDGDFVLRKFSNATMIMSSFRLKFILKRHVKDVVFQIEIPRSAWKRPWGQPQSSNWIILHSKFFVKTVFFNLRSLLAYCKI